MYDPIVLAEETGKLVNSGEKRKYYRFRPAPYYGGIGIGHPQRGQVQVSHLCGCSCQMIFEKQEFMKADILTISDNWKSIIIMIASNYLKNWWRNQHGFKVR